MVTVFMPSGFSSLICSESVVFLCPLQSLCHAISSGVNHNTTARRQFLSSSSLAGSQTWVSSTTRGRRLTFGDSLCYSIQWVESQGWGHLRANLGFGVFWFIPPLLVVAYLPPTSFIGRIFSGLSGGDLAWVQTG